jgi:protein-glucosylgalactosylhydroxylysine glucosidase
MKQIDRYSLVKRNNPVLNKLNKNSPLTVGNGDFAYTADISGFQTFYKAHNTGFPLCIQSNWGWHCFPDDHYNRKNYELLKREIFKVNGRDVGYLTLDKGQEKLFEILRRNPHRLNLGRILLKSKDREFIPEDFRDVNQELDLWSGILTSCYNLRGNKIIVKSACHQDLDAVSFTLTADKSISEKINIIVEFPSAATDLTASGNPDYPGNKTQIIKSDNDFCILERNLDRTRYYTGICFNGCRLGTLKNNRLLLIPESDSFNLVVQFAEDLKSIRKISCSEIEKSSSNKWKLYWSDGGMIDFSGCNDKRAIELERRIVLSQYLTAVHCSGKIPPQETGLSGNSWYGKFHLEMHFWHAAHFPLWKRSKYLENSMPWYFSIMDTAKEVAEYQGYKGARWPKMTCINGWDSPSVIGPFLVWQQPHPIHYAELLYRAEPSKELLEKYKYLVFETAEFMASYVLYDKENDRYILPPPLIPAQENHRPHDVLNPCFELEYFYFGLTTACKWHSRLGLQVPENWLKITENLSKLPVNNDLYIAHENNPDTYENYNADHPSFLCSLGMLPGKRVDKEIMKKSLIKVLKCWDFKETWGWDFPVVAMTCARLGLTEQAVNALLMDTPKNTWEINGHNNQKPKKELPLYLPGNGGLLLAAGMMAAGWKDCTDRKTPGFPQDWNVEYEDILPSI